ncbi:MAG: hypothetical protein K9N51_04820 [Candidatus Pacebacteria bacterium]|nr:hypothetical protein [Candidatus Paceibacterota bacterium]
MKRSWITCLLFAPLLFLSAFCTGTESPAVRGYFKNYSLGLHSPAADERETDFWAVSNRLRLQVSWNVLEDVSLYAAYDISPVVRDADFGIVRSPLGKLDSNAFRITDMDHVVWPETSQGESMLVLHNLDRLYATWSADLADVMVGRQSIAWGSARIVNPTDVLVPFRFNELDQEERPGVDAVRVRLPLGALSEIDAGYVAGEHLDSRRGAWFVRAKGYAWQTDASLLIMRLRNSFLAGIDLTRALGEAGGWLEAAYVIPDAFGESAGTDDSDYLRVSVGMDRQLTSDTYGFLEYHFSTAGKTDAEAYEHVVDSAAFNEGSVYLLGRHYLGLGLTHQITPLITLTANVLTNLGDRSLTIAPALEYNIAPDVYVSVGASVGVGPGPERDGLGSEFGTYPDYAFSAIRVYF